MGITSIFRAHHVELLDIVGQIQLLLEDGAHLSRPEEVVALLGNLDSKLSGHLALEDERLYPKLMDSEDSTIRRMAQEFIDEMGRIGGTYGDYKNAWASASAIQSEPNRFEAETSSLFEALADRIDREDNDLYAQMDALDDAA